MFVHVLQVPISLMVVHIFKVLFDAFAKRKSSFVLAIMAYQTPI